MKGAQAAYSLQHIYKKATFIDRPLPLSLIFPTLLTSPCLLVIALIEGHYNEYSYTQVVFSMHVEVSGSFPRRLEDVIIGGRRKTACQFVLLFLEIFKSQLNSQAVNLFPAHEVFIHH